jgi:hypothetical protein
MLLWLLSACATAQPILHAPDLRLAALRNAVPGPSDALSATRFSAHWAGLPSFSAGFAQEAWAGVKGTGMSCLFLGMPLSGGGFGLVVQHAGDAAFGETVAGIAYARSVTKGLRFGIRLDRYAIHSPAAGRGAAWPADLSLSWQAGHGLQVGFSIYDPLRVSFTGSRSARLPRAVRVFAAVALGPSLSMAAEWESMGQLPPSLAVTVSFRYGRSLVAQVGYVTATGMPFIGMGFHWRTMLLTVGGCAHPALGYRTGTLIQYSRTPTSGS